METKENKKQTKASKEQNPLKEYVKYSGMAFQMLITIGVFIWLGYYFDQLWKGGKPFFILLGSFLGIAASFVVLYKMIKGNQ